MRIQIIFFADENIDYPLSRIESRPTTPYRLKTQTEVTNQHRGRKDSTIILTNGQLAISTTTGEAHV
jgi:hypothetical protein